MPRREPVCDAAGLPLAGLDLADWLASTRRACGLSQRTLARRLGVHDSMVALWERGRRPVPANRLTDLSRLLDVPLDELLLLSATAVGDAWRARLVALAALDEEAAAALAGVRRADPPWCLGESAGCPCPRWECVRCGKHWTGGPTEHACRTPGRAAGAEAA